MIEESRQSVASGVLLGFDFGFKRIGVATGQAVTGTASPLAVVGRRGDAPDWAEIDGLIAEWRPNALVVGLPFREDGSESELTAAARQFGQQLGKRSGLPVHFADERYTSASARSDFAELRRAGAVRRSDRGRLDAVAAQKILETFLDDCQ